MPRPNKTLILHAGMEKTGTTAIQHMLHQARRSLLSHDILVPSTGVWTDHSHHPFAFAAFSSYGHSLADLDRLFAALALEMAEHPTPMVLLSSECLFKLPYRSPDNPFWDHVARHFTEVRVIIYLRRQDSWVESRHRHSIVSRNLFTLDQLSSPKFCNYRPFLDAWVKRFGSGNVTIRPYERALFQGGDIAQDFLAILNLPPGTVSFQSERRNETFYYEDQQTSDRSFRHCPNFGG